MNKLHQVKPVDKSCDAFVNNNLKCESKFYKILKTQLGIFDAINVCKFSLTNAVIIFDLCFQ